MKRITSVIVFSFLVVAFINIKANHKINEHVTLAQWFGVEINERAFLSVANALLLNSILFMGEIA